MPAFIPWSKVELDQWHSSCAQSADWQWGSNLTEDFGKWCGRFESSLDGHGHYPGGRALPRAFRGRGSRLETVGRRKQIRLLRPSRKGECEMSDEMLGHRVQQWFRQLRRFQSMVHAVRAGKQSMEALLYRAQLWGKIRRAEGFEGGFLAWWEDREVKHTSCPVIFSETVPSLEAAEAYFADFEANYRRFK